MYKLLKAGLFRLKKEIIFWLFLFLGFVIAIFVLLKAHLSGNEMLLDKLSNEAIQQIKDRRYDYDLKGKVIYIGLAHHGKDVMMKWEEKVYI